MHAAKRFGGIFDYAGRKQRLAEIDLTLAEADVWNDRAAAESLTRERAGLERARHDDPIPPSSPVVTSVGRMPSTLCPGSIATAPWSRAALTVVLPVA